MKSFTSLQYMSFLDLMCCGMGGGLLLMLIMAAAQPVPATHNPLVVVHGFVANPGTPKAELGLRFQEPGSQQWKRCDARHPIAGQVVFFSASSQEKSGGEIMLGLVNPAPGPWRFQPYLVDYPADRSMSKPIEVQLKAIGQQVEGEIQRHGEASSYAPIFNPGEFGEEWVMSVSSP